MTLTETKTFALAGNATFSLYSEKIDIYRTYNVRQDKSRNDRYFVRYLYGPDNTNDYRILGFFYTDTMVLRKTKNSECDSKAPTFTMLSYFIDVLAENKLWPTTMRFYPSGRCGRCGRLLTTPESIQRGIGPECATKGGII